MRSRHDGEGRVAVRRRRRHDDGHVTDLEVAAAVQRGQPHGVGALRPRASRTSVSRSAAVGCTE